MSEVRKVKRDGMVAVLYSPGFGAGWSSWESGDEDLIFDPELVAAVEVGDYPKMEAIAKQKWPKAYLGGLSSVKIKWLPEGTMFRIHEFDGNETIEVKEDLDWIKA